MCDKKWKNTNDEDRYSVEVQFRILSHEKQSNAPSCGCDETFSQKQYKIAKSIDHRYL